MGDVGELAGGAPTADDAVGGAGADGEGGGGVGVDLAVEFGRKGFEVYSVSYGMKRTRPLDTFHR